jgi:type VI secretion system protein ImpE
MSQSASELYREGKLDAAIAAANDAVRGAPGDAAKRVLLAELLLFAGQLDRADVILDAASRADPAAALAVAEFRQLLRGEVARRQVRYDGRAPEFLGEPTAAMRHLLAALVACRAGDMAEAAREADAAETARPRVAGAIDGTAFDDFRDADDLYAGVFEVLTVTGKYYWVPTERVAEAEFFPAARPRDLVWRRCRMVVRDGPDGEVYVPALYFANSPGPDPVQLGRVTEWSAAPPVTGAGQRMFLAGEDMLPAQQIAFLSFA